MLMICKTGAKKSLSFLMALLLIFSLLPSANPVAKAVVSSPVVIAAYVASGDVTVCFDKNIAAADVSSIIGAFTVTVNNTPYNISSASLATTKSKIKLTMSPKITDGSLPITVSYESDNTIVTPDTSILASFSNVAVTTSAVAPIITSNITDTTTSEGQPVTLSISNISSSLLDGGTITYKWYSNDVQSTTGATYLSITSSSLTPNVATMSEKYFFCVINNNKSGVLVNQNVTTTSNIIKYTVTAPVNAATPQLVGTLSDRNVGLTEPVTLDATATVPDNGTLTYKWYKADDANKTNALQVGDAATYTVDTSAESTYYYYCVVTSTNPDATNNNTAVLTTSPILVNVGSTVNAAAPVIISALPDVLATRTLPVTLDAAATKTDNGTLTYHWYQETATDGSDLTEISNGAVSTCSPDVSTEGSVYYYYCVVTNTNTSVNGATTATITSRPVKVTVVAEPVFIATDPIVVTSQGDISIEFISVSNNKSFGAQNTYLNGASDFTVLINSNPVAVDSVQATNTPGKIKLVLHTKTTGNQTVTVAYTYNPAAPIIAADGSAVLSFAAHAVKNTSVKAATPTITNDLTQKITTVGMPVALNAAATVVDAGTITYQWYKADDASKTNAAAITDATNATYTPPTNATGTFYYYCVVTNTNNSVSGTKTAVTTSAVCTYIVNAVPVTYLNVLGCTVSINNGTSYGALSTTSIYGNANPIPKFKLTFDRAVSAAAAQGNITMTGSSGAISVLIVGDADPNSLIITPNTALSVGTYTLAVSQAFASVDGKELLSGASYTINVTANPLSIKGVTCNNVSLNGATLSTAVPEIKIECDRGMVENLGTNTAMIRLLKGSTPVAINVYMKTTLAENDEVEKRNIYITPSSELKDGAYTLQILSGLKANNGNTLGEDPSAVFASYTFTVSSGNAVSTATTITVTPTTTSGAATAIIAGNDMTSLIDGAKDTESGGGKAITVITVQTPADVASVNLTIPGNSLSALANETNAALTVATGIGTVTFPAAAVDSISKGAGTQDVSIKIDAVNTSTLSAEAQKTVGDRPVYDFTVKAGSTTISTFGGSAVTVSIPYTPAAGEDVNNILIYYISDSGTLVAVPNCVYDPVSGTVAFITTHFSRFAVGYNKVTFTDISGWYAGDVNYLSSRGIVSGIGNGMFNPNGAMTRAAFVMMLANLSGADLSVYKTSAFGDVKTTDWYFKAVQWASANGIVVGYNGKFNPNDNISRQDITAILARYAVKIGYALPITAKAVTFADSNRISAYAADAVKAMQQAGVIAGYSDGSFGPLNNASRAEVSKMVAVFIKGMMTQA